jgi:hypothetical protein
VDVSLYGTEVVIRCLEAMFSLHGINDFIQSLVLVNVQVLNNVSMLSPLIYG